MSFLPAESSWPGLMIPFCPMKSLAAMQEALRNSEHESNEAECGEEFAAAAFPYPVLPGIL